MRVKRERIEKDLKDLARHSADTGGKGITRLPFTPEDRACREEIIGKFEEAGLKVYMDGIGNIFGRREGNNPELPALMIGSHLDTVINAGMFDGPAGVVAGLEVCRTLNDLSVETERAIEVANFVIEESTAFGKSCIGSRAIAGVLDYDELAGLKDKSGRSLQDAFKEHGVTKKEIDNSRRDKGSIDSYIELHIEQSDNLIKAEKPVGVVTTIAAATRFKVTITGQASHSGATPMGERKDALCAASEIILGIEKIATEGAGKDTVGTVGNVVVKPGAINVVPGEAELAVDLRDINNEDKDMATEKIIELIESTGQKRNVKAKYVITANDTPVPASAKVLDTIKEAAKAVDISHLVMHSAAAHDAAYIAEIADMGMIFIRSYGGSHNPDEWAEFEDVTAATEVLLEAAIRLSNE